MIFVNLNDNKIQEKKKENKIKGRFGKQDKKRFLEGRKNTKRRPEKSQNTVNKLKRKKKKRKRGNT